MARRGKPAARRRALASCVAGAVLAGCSGMQSALAPAGQQASELADVFWWMTGASLVIWLAVVGVALYAGYAPEQKSLVAARRLIIYGGVVLPTVLLAVLLAYGLWLLPGYLAPAPAGSLRIEVSGEQFWWRVRYLPEHGPPVSLANELRLPVGEPVQLELSSPDVIHSLWIPALGGKMDMIPGRTTRLVLSPTRTGTFRGQCAEYCGTAHAWMAFMVVVQERTEFERWLAEQAAPARKPADERARRGREVLLRSGCGACHTVRGTSADGVVGPDLTHVGGRLSLAAGLLDNRAASFADWLERTKTLKPGVHMPAFGMLPSAEREALAAYLEGLK